LVLAIFNALPIPPLDGSKIIMGMMPNQLAYHYAKWERFGIIIVLILLNVGLFEVIIAIAAVLARWMGINLI
ncbi:MAG TPA: site-2 protease family protein, partial [Candidatus Omnitrophota bacterium]|nr:site-2 protease family protein [Candidatus Omnitrophota bacterium]